MKSLSEVIAAVQLLQKAETERMKITLEFKQGISNLQTKVFYDLIQRDKFVTELINTLILGVVSKQLRLLRFRVGDSTTLVNSLSPRIILKLIQKQYKSLEILIQNSRHQVNLIANKSTAKNILINNVEEKSTENALQLITKVNQIMHDVHNTIHVTHAYRIG